ncbi:MAG: N-acetylmuramoyl-L-alanine amidase [Gammaproteobacteria bacterium]
MARVLAKLSVFAALILGLVTVQVMAAASVTKMRSYAHSDHTRVVFELSAPVGHTLFTLEGPDRVVLDLTGARIGSRFSPKPHGDLLQGVRYAPRKQSNLRFVLDLKGQVRPKSFLLRPSGKSGHRLVVDLYPKRGSAESETRKAVKSIEALNENAEREVVIAVDAGHGGADPGALGPRGTKEKVATLAIARKLVAMINREPGMRAVLTRNGDYFLKLRTRINRARKAKADLFLSIHADGFRDARARGSSVYILSRRGASSEAARWLAVNENKADLVGGVRLDDKDDQLAQVLLDLSQNGTLEASHSAAKDVLAELKRIGKVHKRQVERAAFVVLKSPDIPSMLVETAFISNPSEEAKLRSSKHQKRMAQAILRGLRSYFRDHAPPGTWFAKRRQTVASRGKGLDEG